MGGEASRLEKRVEFIDDMNTVGLNFVGGCECEEFDELAEKCPFDHLVVSYGQDRDPAKLFAFDGTENKSKDEEQTKNAFDSIIKSLELKKSEIDKEFKRTTDDKASLVGQKYNKDEALKQIQTFIDELRRIGGFPIPGEEEEKKKERETAMENLSPVDNANSGWENLNAHCVKLFIQCPFVYDVLKSDTLKWEVHKLVSDKKKRYKEDKYLGSLSGIAGEIVRQKQYDKALKSGEVVYFAGYLGQEDFNHLLESLPEKRRNMIDLNAANDDDELEKILMPGITKGLTSMDLAKKSLLAVKETESKQNVKRVIFEIANCRPYDSVEESKFVHRQLAEVRKHYIDLGEDKNEKDRIDVFKMSGVARAKALDFAKWKSQRDQTTNSQTTKKSDPKDKKKDEKDVNSAAGGGTPSKTME